MTSILESNTKPQEFSKDVTPNVQTHMVANHTPHNPPSDPLFDEEEDEISDEELSCSYMVFYENWANQL